MKITIIIPTKNREGKLKNLLNSLETQSKKNFEVVIVNDGRRLVGDYNRVSFPIKLCCSNGLGVSRARNIGINNCVGDVLIFLGDDTYPTANFVEEHFNFHKSNPKREIAMLGKIEWKNLSGVIYSFLNSGIQFDFANLKNEKMVDICHFYTANVSLKRDMIGKVRFNEKIKMPGWEDIEFASRLEQKGLKIIYNEDAVVFHDHFFDEMELAKRAFRLGVNYKIIEKEFPEKKPKYELNLKNNFKFCVLSALKSFDRLKFVYFWHLHMRNFMKGYYAAKRGK